MFESRVCVPRGLERQTEIARRRCRLPKSRACPRGDWDSVLYVYRSDMAVTATRLESEAAPWLFFMFQLPAQSASQRVSVWRKLQKFGALPWKNSAYLLPHTPGNLEKFQWLTAQIRKYHGDASIVQVARVEGYSRKRIIALFNQARERDYERLAREITLALRAATRRENGRGPGVFARLNRRLSDIAVLDSFGCPKRKEAEALLKELEGRLRGDHPPETPARRRFREFRGRLWMTRPRPEVDRVASAWLIRHSIDPRAKFTFSPDPRAHPRAVRFDMYEGEFTHVGEDCTFETLLKRFGLRDRRLRLIGQIVHDADLEDNKFGRAEGKAIDLIIKGWGKIGLADEEILRRGFELFEALYNMLGS